MPDDIFAFSPIQKSCDLAIGIALKDFPRSRLPRSEENIAHFDL